MSKTKNILVAAISLLIATGFTISTAQVASACTSSSSTSSGLSYGSSTDDSSVTLCLGETIKTPATTSSETKTTVLKPKAKSTKKNTTKVSAPIAKAPTKPEAKVAKVQCPSSQQLASMPKSADAAARWVESLCNPKPKVKLSAKPAPKPTPKAAPKPIAKKLTTTVVNPGSKSSSSKSATFRPNPLIARYTPNRVLATGEAASFSTNPTLHFRTQSVLGRMAEVQFTPASVSWSFSDGESGLGSVFGRSFPSEGSYWALARVRYLVSYRLVGETSWQQAGFITIQSNLLELLVGKAELASDDGPIVLVGEDCLARVGSYGCTN